MNNKTKQRNTHHKIYPSPHLILSPPSAMFLLPICCQSLPTTCHTRLTLQLEPSCALESQCSHLASKLSCHITHPRLPIWNPDLCTHIVDAHSLSPGG